jgi:hypothetical protein
VECRDSNESWRTGIVEEVTPKLKVMPDGWDSACHWDEVRARVKLGDQVQVRDTGEEWRAGKVTQTEPVEVLCDGMSSAYTWDEMRR